MRKFVENLQTQRVRKENGEIGRNPEEAQRVLSRSKFLLFLPLQPSLRGGRLHGKERRN